ncbi:MAG: hypothetical protein K1Y02_08425 [Candidatus Hydrogenedentes bacterium]|nr:hypothetical protein [Candidatus Hydrogenedentota bacterium]
MAASIYGDASTQEKRLLEEAMARDAGLRREYEALSGLREAIPVNQPELKFDLAPLVRNRLASSPATARGRRVALALATVACVVVLAALGFVRSDKHASPVVHVASTVGATGSSPLGAAIEKADALVKQGDLATAYQSLQDCLAANADDVKAGDAQLRVADLAYDLKRYPEALAATTALMTRYHDYVKQTPERERHVIARRDLLAEAESVQFASLYALDTARKDRTDPFGKLESIIVGNKDSLVAEEAALDMGKLLLAEAESGKDANAKSPRLTAMTLARDRCTDPIAVALLEIKIGEIYQNDLRDFSSAEEHFKRAAENPVYAKRATAALMVLAEERKR